MPVDVPGMPKHSTALLGYAYINIFKRSKELPHDQTSLHPAVSHLLLDIFASGTVIIRYSELNNPQPLLREESGQEQQTLAKHFPSIVLIESTDFANKRVALRGVTRGQHSTAI